MVLILLIIMGITEASYPIFANLFSIPSLNLVQYCTKKEQIIEPLTTQTWSQADTCLVLTLPLVAL